MKITTLVPPAASAVSLEQARAFLRVAYGGEDDLLADLVAAAVAQVEALTSPRLMAQTLRIDLDCWPETALASGWLELPVRPVRDVTLITANGEDVTDQFELMASPWPRLWPLSFWPPGGDGISITLEAGYAGADDIPADLLLAVRELAANGYHRREGDAPAFPEDDMAALIAAWRRVRL